MQINTYKCDMCGTVKGENNHWFRICNADGIKLEAWNKMPSSETTVDLCSDSCVIKVVQKWLTSQAHSTAPVHDAMRMPYEVTPPRVV
jgi:hypothetical protein